MKFRLLVTLLIFTISIKAQNFTGKAVYKTSRKTNIKIGGDNSNMSDKMQKQIQDRIRKMSQKTFVLEFDKSTSVYKEDVKLNAPKPAVGGVSVMTFSSGGIGGTYYKNLKEKRFANKTEIMGKPFLVKDSLSNYNWELTSETKNIGNYTCYKATFTREVEIINMSLVNDEPKEIAEKKTVVTTAWYTTQVPISNGPSDYQGLPGLILEINDGKTIIVCTEIIMNPSEEIKIIEPKKGKVVTQAKYEKISEEKAKEMMERFKSKNGNGMEIRIGG